MLSVLKLYIGKLLNLAGYPAIVRECEYRSSLDTIVRVKKNDLFTLVTVNGVDVYFNRITGTIDGVGFSPNVYCTTGIALESEHPVVQLDTPEIPAHMRTIAGSTE